MTQLILDPPRAAGPIVLGMPFAEAVEVLRKMPGYVAPEPGTRRQPGFAHYESGLTISVAGDRRGFVEAVELYRPEREVTVLFRGIDVFGPAEGVVRRLGALTTVEVEDDGYSVVAPDLLLSFGGNGDSDNPDDAFFESVLVARPGYYDGPAADAPLLPTRPAPDDPQASLF